VTSETRPLPTVRIFLLAFKLPWKPLLLAVVAVLALIVGSTARHLAVLPATGSHTVGRDRVILIDADRPETHTADLDDVRSVPLQLWYPAEPGTGRPARYVEDLSVIGEGLVSSDALNRFELTGLRWVRTSAMEGADVAVGTHALPVVVLSPGNQTNVSFYATLAEELASQGYLVVGVDHAFQVAATTIAEGSVAVYDTAMDLGDPRSAIAAKIEERTDDVVFVLDALRSGVAELGRFRSVSDLDRVGILGHSNGGLTAFEVCRVDPSVDACLNMDGQAAGGALGHEEGAVAPQSPFLFLTKETRLHPAIAARFEESAAPAVRAVIPDATHDSFTDGAMFRPRVNPFTTTAQSVMTTIRSVALAFFDNWLRESEQRPYDGLVAPADLYINVYPLGDMAAIPRE
jgi:dienelactone hydrolase